MITRLWRGWTRVQDAEAYERFLLDELFPSMRAIDGFESADVLTRAEGEEVAFVTLTRFASRDAIRAFAGADYETPVLEPRALELLSRYDEKAQHFETSSFTPRHGGAGEAASPACPRASPPAGSSARRP